MTNLCVSNLCWFFEDEKAFEILKNLNVKKVELSPVKQFGPWDSQNIKDIKNFKNKIKNHYGLEVASLQSIFYQKEINIFDNNKEFIEHFKKVIEISEILQNPYIVFGSPKVRSMNKKSFEICENIFLDTFEKISNLNSEITIGIETNPTYYNNFFLTKEEQCRKTLNKLNKDNLVFHFDLACIELEGDNPIQIYENNYLKHLHISSRDLKTIKNKNTERFFSNISPREKTTYSIEMLNQDETTIVSCIKFMKKELNL